MEFLVVDDDKTFRDATCLLVEEEGHYAEGAEDGNVGLARLRGEQFDAVLLDLNLGGQNGLEVLDEIRRLRPNLPVILITADGDVESAVEAMRRGALDFLEKPFQRGQFITTLARLRTFHQLGRRIVDLEATVSETNARSPGYLFDFGAGPMAEVMSLLERSAGTMASILILGESGTGKSVVAREIHRRSHLADKPFVTVSCPSLSRELLESDLFGHVKGAFTGAVKDHWGKVKAAEGGTLFLDEIGELPLEIQPKLLRLLQEREYERLGDNVTRTANVRVMTASNRDLKTLVREGAFREDLFYRLNVISVSMPPLRDRPGDLRRLAEHYGRHFSQQSGRAWAPLSEEAWDHLRTHDWPGNLRELQNAMERAVILSSQPGLAPADFPPEMNSGSSGEGARGGDLRAGSATTLEQLETEHIKQILQSSPSYVRAAEILGIDEATLFRKRKKLGLD